MVLARVARWGVGYSLSRPTLARVGAAPADLEAETVRIPRTGGAPIVGWLARGARGQGASQGARAALAYLPRAMCSRSSGSISGRPSGWPARDSDVCS